MGCRDRIVLAALLAAALGCAASDESHIGAETEVLDPGECEVEAGVERESRHGAPRRRQSMLQFGCGIGWQSELELGLARERSGPDRERAIELQARTLLDEKDSGEAWSLTYGVAGEREAGARWRHAGHFVAVEWTRPFAESWLFEARAGVARDVVARRDRSTWGFAVEHQLGDAAELRVEVEGHDRRRTETAVALRWSVFSEDVFFTLSRSWPAGAGRPRAIAFSLTVEF